MVVVDGGGSRVSLVMMLFFQRAAKELYTAAHDPITHDLPTRKNLFAWVWV